MAKTNDIPTNETRAFKTDDALNQFLVDNPNRTRRQWMMFRLACDEIRRLRYWGIMVLVNPHFFKMLTTTSKPSGGDAFIYGLSVQHDLNAVRKLLGVCPLFEMYWDKLTGAENIEIFAALKGLSRGARSAEVDRRMADVDLIPKANVYAGEYSGGMQRRLSVALSLTGDPKKILLDECTSGADPLVRRDLWAAIQRAKAGRVIFLITH